MSKPQKTMKLYRVADHNTGVLEVEFSYKKTVQDGSGDCDIYHADCPYGYNERGITVSLQRFQHDGYYNSYQKASNACILRQQEEVDSTGRSFRAAQELLNELEVHCPIIKPNKE